MDIPSTIDMHNAENPDLLEFRPRIMITIPEARVVGVHPFMTEEHTVKLAPNTQKTLWHDGTHWRLSAPGWGPQYASRVVRWPVIERLDVNVEYTLHAPRSTEESVSLLPKRPA